ncbi:MAG: hypothetical protein OXN17_05040 [Candidatus Poribacteria bacterium]|nr:hypothetical protein [Candidatus Poribacteria bacterium]
MIQISGSIATLFIFGVANIGVTSSSDLARSGGIPLMTAKFLPDTMPELENWRWPPGGHYLIAVRNTGKSPVEVKDIRLDEMSVVDGLKTQGNLKTVSIWNGEDLTKPSAQTKTLRDAGEPIWYKIRPASIDPGALGFVLIRTRFVPGKPVKVSVIDNRDSAYTAVVATEEPMARIAFVGFGASCERMTVFVRKLTPEDLTLDGVYLDDVDITARCKFESQDFWNDLGILTVALDTPLKEGSHHLLRLTTKQGVEITDMVRARNDFFPVGVYGWSSKGETAVERMYDFYRSLKAHHFNTGLVFVWPKDSAMRNSVEGRELAKRNDIMLLDADDKHWYVRDEIDIWEGVHLKDFPESKRLGCMAQTDVIDFMRHKLSEDTAALGWLQLDGWGHPANYFIHARGADISSSGDYAGQGAKQPIEVYNAVNALRWAAMPGGFNTLIYAAWEHSIGVPRFPTPQEEKMMAYYCLASGGKGLCYYTYDDSKPEGSGDHGVEANPTLLSAIGQINLTVQTLTPLLLSAYPCDGIVSRHSVESEDNSDALWHRALLCADGTVILILVNHDFTSEKEKFTNTPLNDVRLELQLPPWEHHQMALAMDGNGIRELEFSTDGGDRSMTLYLPELITAELIVIGTLKVGAELGRRFGILRHLANQRAEQLTARLEAERAELNRRRAILRDQGILLESGCEIGDGRDLADWREEGDWPRVSRPDSEEKRNGEYSLRVTERKQYSLPVDIPDGIRCRLEFYVKFSEIGGNEAIHAAIEYLDENGTIIDTTSVTQLASASDWKLVTCESIAPPGALRAQIRFQMEGATGSAWVDDVRLMDASYQERR